MASCIFNSTEAEQHFKQYSDVCKSNFGRLAYDLGILCFLCGLWSDTENIGPLLHSSKLFKYLIPRYIPT